ncbi:hypothetical protein [Dechloromonas sp. A34]|uniref:hypothetical protein n=1 Tax=Dechloromonas sp. A34 TaxID=447588 RepID=UPI002248FF7A|nr:hypothetical protein [Dechloromonas sp. A34]
MRTKREARDSADRRQEELGPPQGWKDRRRRTERRMPEINEYVVSESEWLSYFGAVRSALVPANTLATGEVAADIFDRIRN